MSSNWLDEHLETFVRPYLGYIPDLPDKPGIEVFNKSVLTERSMSCIVAVWRQAKKLAGSRQILLAGRDVWLFEVLARLEDFPTIWRPDISSCVAPHVKEDYRECYSLDTGFSGSIARYLKIPNFSLIVYCPSSTGDEAKAARKLHQVFPNMREVRYNPSGFMKGEGISVLRNLAGTLEGLNKYWLRGDVNQPWPEHGPKTIKSQGLSSKLEFTGAAISTRQFATYVREQEKRCGYSCSMTRFKAIGAPLPKYSTPTAMTSPSPPPSPKLSTASQLACPTTIYCSTTTSTGSTSYLPIPTQEAAGSDNLIGVLQTGGALPALIETPVEPGTKNQKLSARIARHRALGSYSTRTTSRAAKK